MLILVGAGILWGKSLVTTVSGLFKPSTTVVEAPKDASPLSKPKIPDRVGQPSFDGRPGRAGGAARGAV